MLSEQDRVKFLAALPKLLEYAKMQKTELTKQEVESFFGGIALTKEHYDQIYAYLLANEISVKDGNVLQKNVRKYKNTWKRQKTEEKSAYLQMYLQDLDNISACSVSEEKQLYQRLLQGDKQAQKRLAEGKLYRVVELVREYVEDSFITEDLIQEGNMGLLAALSELYDAKEKREEDCAKMIDDYIRQWIAFAVDDQIRDSDQETKIVAKINLIHEAARTLAEELGRIATVLELSEYTKLPLEEIEDMINLSEGSIDVGKGDIEEAKGSIIWDFK